MGLDRYLNKSHSIAHLLIPIDFDDISKTIAAKLAQNIDENLNEWMDFQTAIKKSFYRFI